MNIKSLHALAAAASLTLIGCSKDTEVAVPHSHTAKSRPGSHDQGDPSARAGTLRQRFKQVQTDR